MFAVLCGPRCGSHLLMTLLNSHPALTCYDEILGFRGKQKNFYELGDNEGCLANYQNFLPHHRTAEGNDIPRLVSILREVPIIHLTRDPTERARSHHFISENKRRHKLKHNSNRPYYLDGKLDQYDEEQVRVLREIHEREKAACLKLFEGLQYNWLEITYEWLCDNQEIKHLPIEKSRTICKYLGVKPRLLTTPLYKIRTFGRKKPVSRPRPRAGKPTGKVVKKVRRKR